ncbi:SDR family NAD(P)-dependent oxidoreductase [Companilactobacillus nuruki]|uniref:Short-chain dehydrogenase/reductase n=1 Tax=Companilactobacillus nuruki TaxID=1993540 RepID=A0A2N7ARQ3_9LACO|nr:SDR family NAD(P)-dependent oxidoreductase [Companilactobacillus nuruki]PMD68038.1 short-chain dehydrogenase/reductase [Companilactobacillus nuruki]
MTKVAIITGISAGMGHAAALYFKEKGYEVYGGARRMDRMQDLAEQGVHVQELDLTDKISIRQLVDRTIKEQGKIDVLINNAGYGEYGPLEEVPTETAKRQFEVNLFGANEITQFVLPTMRNQGYGRIVNVSSIGGDLYTPLGGWYHATKAGVNMWSDVLDMEVKPFGIRSVVVQPGGTATEWQKVALENAHKNLQDNSPYEALVDREEEISGKFSFSATAEDLAKVFYKAATDAKPKRRYFNSIGDHAAVIFARTMPNAYRAIVSKIV